MKRTKLLLFWLPKDWNILNTLHEAPKYLFMLNGKILIEHQIDTYERLNMTGGVLL